MRNLVNVFGLENLDKHEDNLHMEHMLGFPCLFTADLYAKVDAYPGKRRLRLLRFT